MKIDKDIPIPSNSKFAVLQYGDSVGFETRKEAVKFSNGLNSYCKKYNPEFRSLIRRNRVWLVKKDHK